MDRNLKAFLAITEHGNLTIAAEKIGLTQPSLTKRLSNLEQELGSQLFDRTRRGMLLTPAGSSFLRRAKRIEQEMLQANEEIRGLVAAGLDVLRVGAGPLFHQRFVAPAFSKLLFEFPAIKLDLTVFPIEIGLPKLIKGELDIVLGAIQPTSQDAALLSIQMTILEHGIIIPPETDIKRKPTILPKDMRDMRWVLYGDDHDTEIWLNGYFQRNGLGTPNIAVRTASFATGLGLVRNSGFVMMAPVQLAPVIEEAGLRVLCAQPALTKLTSGAYVRVSSMGIPAIRRFLEILEAEIKSSKFNLQQ